MKILVLVIATFFISTALLMAEEPQKDQEKDVCLLDSRQCRQSLDLLEKIARLKKAIAKGSPTYTSEELEVLQKRLDESLRIADELEIPENMIAK